MLLKRKLWRDIKGNYGAYLACIVVIIIGLMLYTSLSLALLNMRSSVQEYYQKNQLADGFAQVIRAPYSLTSDLEKLPGINRVIGRIIQDFLVFKASGEETTTVRLISFTKEQPLNRFQLSSGHLPSPGAKELLISPTFMQANRLQPGDILPLIIQGREVSFKITGAADSPEYTYEIPNGQTVAPNAKAFGVAYIPYQSLAAVTGMEGQINDLAFTLDKGVKYTSIRNALTRKLKPYGLLADYPQKDQLSCNILAQEIQSLKASAATTPTIFLLVASAIIYIMLRRMVDQQRGQIGLLKAFGYTSWQIVIHYLGYAWLIGLLGGLGGGLSGTWLSFYIMDIYRQYYKIPNLTSSISLSYLAAGTLFTLLFTTIAGYQGCKSVLALTPAEAMHPVAPKAGSRIFLERVQWLWQLFNSQTKMAVRNIFRTKQRSLFALGGVACAFSLMLITLALIDSTEYFVTFQYEAVERYDLKVGLHDYVSKTAGLTASKSLAGVQKAEPILSVPVTISHRWLEKDIAVLGLPPNATLYQLLNQQGEQVTPPSSGLIISGHLAKLLAIQPGDQVILKLFSGDQKKYAVQVHSIIPQYVGLGAYMEIDALAKLLKSQPLTSALLLKTDPAQLTTLRKELQKGQNVATVQDKNLMAAQFKEMMASASSTQYILLAFGFITGFAIIYNINLIALSERQRELATLMVIGMTEQEVGYILVLEQTIIGCFGAICGLPLAYGMLVVIIQSTSSDIFNMPLILTPQSIFIALMGTVSFIIAAQWKIKAKINSLSTLDVLKEQS